MSDDELDAAWEDLIVRLPEHIRSRARALPGELRLAQRGSGRWSDYVRLEPLRDLPSFVVDDDDLAHPERLARFRVAHLLGGFCGTILDRILDRQLEEDAEIHHIHRCLLDAWRGALAFATGDDRIARSTIATALVSLKTGNEVERRCLEQRRMTIAQYARVVEWKVAWLGISAIAYLGVCGYAARIPAFHRSFTLFLLGLQLLDDAADEEEDEDLHGTGMPRALGVDGGMLQRAAPRVLAGAAREAHAGGFHLLAEWLDSHTLRIAAAFTPTREADTEAAALATALEAKWRTT